jgi:monothiol glutaredoxin
MSNPFQVVGGNAKGESEQNKSLDLNSRIGNLINSAPIMLFMKGTPAMPQCGFSANVCKILNHLGVSYNTFDIYSDADIRDGVKHFSNWPTYPQLYVKGQLIGGNDIVTEMMNNGELEQVLKL